MFYSHSLLARKSPLGTVWMAAHLQQRIKKPQIDVIDIPSYAECIMFPEVPIALRLSGHLLLGLVRIYSLKVKYLCQDCNRMLSDIRTVFASVQINLPVDADRAPFESVTLPSNFELDSVELDDYLTNGPDNHLKTFDQITLQDQIPFIEEQYVSVYIREENRIDMSPHPETSNPGLVPMEEDILSPFDGGLDDLATPIENIMGGRNHGSSNLMEEDILPPFNGELGDLTTPFEHTNNHTDSSVPNLNQHDFSNESPEVMRDAVHNSGPELGDNDFEELHEQSVPSINNNGNLTLIVEDQSVSGEGSFPSSGGNKVPTTVASADDPDILNTGISLEEHLPDMELKPSPSVNKHKGKKRKSKQIFDDTLVLSNAEMKEMINNTSKLVCKRRKLPCFTLDVWRSHRTRNEHIFHEPLLTGMCTKLKEVYGRRFPPSRCESASIDASSSGHVGVPEMDPVIPDMDTDPVIPDMDIETELPRHASHVDDITHDLMQSSPGREEFTPSVANIGSVSDKGKTMEPEVLPTYGISASTEPTGTEPVTPSVNLEEQLNIDNSISGDFPNIRNSADVEELNFLEASNASSSYDVTEVGIMSERTRKVAQYLKEHSPEIHTPVDLLGCLSLNRILEGKTRKQAARMFFETLVLKTYGLIDVQQNEDYGDISISRTPALSSIKF